MRLQQPRHGAHVGQDARQVRGGREGAHDGAAFGGPKRRGKDLHVRPAPGRLRDHPHLGAGLAPGQDVGMVLVGADQDQRLRRAANPEEMRQPVDPRRGPAPAEDHRVIRAGVHVARDHAARGLAQARGRRAAMRRGGVGVAVGGQDLLHHEHLDLPQRPARGGVIRIDQLARPERTLEGHPVADQPLRDLGGGAEAAAELCETGVGRGHLSGSFAGEGGANLARPRREVFT
jgi:hypothetical protein